MADAERASMLRTFLQLVKARIAVAVLVSSAMGFLMAAGSFSTDMLAPLFGVFLLACGALALNQCQEAAVDARMERTRMRPIQAGHIDRTASLFIAVLLMLLGSWALTSTACPTELLFLGLFAVVWYNGVYTYLKRVTAFAVVPGALIGAVPPAIGWVAGGGKPDDPMILLLATFYFIWQVPHFWLLMARRGEEYARAGLPSLTKVFTPEQLGRVTFMWVLATAAAGMVFPALSPRAFLLPWRLALLFASIWLAFKATRLLGPVQTQPTGLRRTFLNINIYGLVVSVVLSLNGIAGP